MPESSTIVELLRPQMALLPLLPAGYQQDLLRFIADFLQHKTFYGCNGLTVTDGQRVLVAAVAGLVGLYQPVSFFRSTRWILLYPDLELLDGEAFDASKVVLSWNELAAECAELHFGRNLGVHEFTHVMDRLLGISGGTVAQRQALAVVQQGVLAGTERLFEWQAAEGPEEFLAAAAELYFSAPVELQTDYPALYAELRGLFRVDMATLLGPWPAEEPSPVDG